MVLINTSKIKGRLAEKGLTQKDVAAALGIAQPTANQKINNTRPMDLDAVSYTHLTLPTT